MEDENKETTPEVLPVVNGESEQEKDVVKSEKKVVIGGEDVEMVDETVEKADQDGQEDSEAKDQPAEESNNTVNGVKGEGGAKTAEPTNGENEKDSPSDGSPKDSVKDDAASKGEKVIEEAIKDAASKDSAGEEKDAKEESGKTEPDNSEDSKSTEVTKSTEVKKSTDVTNVETTANSPSKNLRKRKAQPASNGYTDPGSSDDDIQEIIVEPKKTKLAPLDEKSIKVPVASVTKTPVVPITYSVGQSIPIVGTSILPNQQVRMVLPTVSSSTLLTQNAQPLLISQPQNSLLATQGLTINPTGVVVYNQLQPGSASAMMSNMLTTAAQKLNTKGTYGISLVGLGNTGKTVQAMRSAPTTVTAGNKIAEKVELRPPTDSLEMIQLVKWELKQGVYHRPKNFKLKPDSEMGPMAKFLRDFGQDLVKEAVYNDLVHIQSRRSDHGKLTDKEKKDFQKLKSVHSELKEKVGPLKVTLSKKCKCGFKTESEHVMYTHRQHPHVKENDLICAHCDFESRDKNNFIYHLEAEHAKKAKFIEKPAFWACSLCPYETNIRNKLTQHRFRCIKTFKLNLNLHPAWLPGPETNYCLEKIFYKNPMMAYMSKLNQQQGQQGSTVKPIMPKGQGQVQVRQSVQGQTVRQMIKNIPGAKGASVNTQPVRNQQLLAKLGNNLQAQNIYQKGNFIPNVNMFNKGNNQIRPNTNIMKKTVNNVGMQRQNMPKLNNIMSKPIDKVAANKPNGFEVCEICGGYVKDRTALRIHFFYAHRIDMPHGVFDRVHPPLYCATCFARFWTAQGLQKHLDVHKEDSSGGVAGKCIVCLHRVPNILMHMKIVHNKAFVNFLRECKCIFCGVKFPSKSVVEKHMAGVHGVVVKSGAQPQASPQQKKQVNAGKGGKNDLVKGSVCVLCNLNFGRNVDLTRHCMRVHHTCMKCGMVVADKESLLKHSCLDSPSGLRNCEVCKEKGFHPAYHVKHIRDKHLRKLSIRVKRLDRQTIAKWTKQVLPPPVKKITLPSEPIELSDDDEEPAPKRARVEEEKPAVKCEEVKKDEVVVLGDDDVKSDVKLVIDKDIVKEEGTEGNVPKETTKSDTIKESPAVKTEDSTDSADKGKGDDKVKAEVKEESSSVPDSEKLVESVKTE